MYYGNHPDDDVQNGLGFDPATIIGGVGLVGSLAAKLFGGSKEEKERKKLEKAVKRAETLQQQQIMLAEEARLRKEREQKMWLYTLGAAGALVVGLLVISKVTKK